MDNTALEQMMGIYSGTITEDPREDLLHYGRGHLDGGHSGRYPWGSGEDPHQHQPRMYGLNHEEFLSEVSRLEKEGATYTDPKTNKVYTGDTAIAKILGVSSTEYRVRKQYENHVKREEDRNRAIELRLEGKTNQEISDILNASGESYIRNLIKNTETADRNSAAFKTADTLKEILKEKRIIDVGPGVAAELGVSDAKLKEAEYILKLEGYNMYPFRREQITNPGKYTTVNTLALPDVLYKEVYGPDAVKSITEYHSDDGGASFRKVQYPASIDSSRIAINYADTGNGDAKDGLIEIRRGVPDLSLGESHYAQVRILVDGTHYLKGMAVYSDDIPEGKDILFNTNKNSDVPMIDGKKGVLKPIKTTDPDNPFGAYIKANGQSTYTGPDGEEHLSAINKLKSEGDWNEQQLTLSSQFLSKQPLKLIKTQLDLSYKDKLDELSDIESLDNPTIRKKYLMDFADDCDTAAQHLKAAALPRQSSKVLLPLPDLKDDEVYAPTYEDGERLALIRYPHAGTFEIPILTVNNQSKRLRKMIDPSSIDAIGITPVAAKQLSGADFDGDSVIVIPLSEKVRIKNEAPLKELRDFDHLTQYAIPDGSKVKPMTEEYKQKQMGVVSNLITDMTLKGAPIDDIVKAVKHSMVVIDAVKHKLDYRQSEKDNDIEQLKKIYQLHYDIDGVERGGASTLLSMRKQDIEVPERRGGPHINPDGSVWYDTTGRTYLDKKGNVVEATEGVKLLKEVKDLHALSSGTRQEEAYADYGNKLKALANRARKEYLAVKEDKRDPNAAKEYSTEVDELMSSLKIAEANRPKERRAQSLAWAKVKGLIEKNPELTDKSNKKELSRIKNAAIIEARLQVGAKSKDTKIQITDRQWEAIQAKAISPSVLTRILRYSNADSLRDRAMPRATNEISSAKQARIKALASSGYTTTEIAKIIGHSVSTVTKYLKPND